MHRYLQNKCLNRNLKKKLLLMVMHKIIKYRKGLKSQFDCHLKLEISVVLPLLPVVPSA